MQLHTTLSGNPLIHKAGWVAAKLGDNLDVVIDAALSPRLRAMALLEALTDGEYAELADATLSGLPRQRVVELIREPA
jgi:hypothetical protein